MVSDFYFPCLFFLYVKNNNIFLTPRAASKIRGKFAQISREKQNGKAIFLFDLVGFREGPEDILTAIDS